MHLVASVRKDSFPNTMLAAIRVSTPGTGRTNRIACHWLKLSSWGRQSYCSPLCAQDREATVAVIGGGAAGLTAAYFAALKLNETECENKPKVKVRIRTFCFCDNSVSSELVDLYIAIW